MEREMDSDELRLVGGLALTGTFLAAQHWFPAWRKLHRLEAYTLGTLAICLGQGLYLGFNRTWRRLMMMVVTGGAVVYGAYVYDALANRRAVEWAGGSDGLPAPPKR